MGARSTESSMLELINKAKDEIQILSYAVTTGANKVLLAIDKALNRGVKFTFVINRSEEFGNEIIDSLNSLKGRNQSSKIYIFDPYGKVDLHAKIMVVDRKIAIVGSSNLTSRGFIWNLEIGFLIEDNSVWKLAQIIDKIAEMSTPF